MKYSTSDYLIDSFWAFEPIFNIIKFIRRKIKLIFLNLLEIDYAFYTLRILQNIPEALLIVYLGFLAVFSLIKFTESANGVRIYPIVTSSMQPEITPGSLVFSSTAMAYNKGDIISYSEETKYGVPTGKILTHRIIEKTENGYITKGDANSDSDPQVIGKPQIRGKVLIVLPLLGYLEILIKTIPGFLVLVVAPTVFVVVSQLKDLKN